MCYGELKEYVCIQVLSNSVAKELLCLLATRHRIYFAEIFDRFFDCLNSSSLSAGKRSRNPFRSPYRSGTDWKLKVNCMAYLNLHIGPVLYALHMVVVD